MLLSVFFDRIYDNSKIMNKERMFLFKLRLNELTAETFFIFFLPNFTKSAICFEAVRNLQQVG